MKALVVIGHLAPNSFSHALGHRVVQGWRKAGVDVTVHDLATQSFDPCLTASEARGAPSEDLEVRRHIADLTSTDLLAVVHPVMWGMPPAILKGWIDRVFALNAAYGLTEEGEAIGLLPLRAALILNTSNTPPAREAARFGDPLDRIWRDCILGFCSAAHVTRQTFAPLAPSTDATRARWLSNASALAQAVLMQGRSAG